MDVIPNIIIINGHGKLCGQKNSNNV